jgi:hypothetical protein
MRDKTRGAGGYRRDIVGAGQPVVGDYLEVRIVNRAIVAEIACGFCQRSNAPGPIKPDVIDVQVTCAASLRTAPVTEAKIHLLDARKVQTGISGGAALKLGILTVKVIWRKINV